jgi:hypothetical protein
VFQLERVVITHPDLDVPVAGLFLDTFEEQGAATLKIGDRGADRRLRRAFG